ncbi:hypothetical protein ACFY8P_36085 [Streptomyces sp. NPDC012693]|uniref:hypothetical protein n=1 Tax=Streptomyces sp. NPDC012693 TaxID=3364844 RepID=UPI0036B243A4
MAVAGAAFIVVLAQQLQGSAEPVEEEVNAGIAGPGHREQAAGNVDGDDGRGRGEAGVVAGGVGAQAGCLLTVSGCCTIG